MKICSKCGAEIPDNAAFCTKCGAKVEADPNAPVKKRISPYAIVGFVLGILSLLTSESVGTIFSVIIKGTLSDYLGGGTLSLVLSCLFIFGSIAGLIFSIYGFIESESKKFPKAAIIINAIAQGIIVTSGGILLLIELFIKLFQ